MLASEDAPAVRLYWFRATDGTKLGDGRGLGMLLELEELELVGASCRSL